MEYTLRNPFYAIQYDGTNREALFAFCAEHKHPKWSWACGLSLTLQFIGPPPQGGLRDVNLDVGDYLIYVEGNPFQMFALEQKIFEQFFKSIENENNK